MKQGLKLLLLLGLVCTFALADTNFSFTGNFTQDDNVQVFTFTTGAASTITLRTWSYAGGTNAAGQVIARGGFDPILALFDSSGVLINQNDDGGGSVAADSVTGQHYDTYLSAAVGIGTYTATVMEYNNFAIGPNYSNGFARAGQGNFTGTGGFWDVTGSHRDNHWAFDVLNVASASTVPEPGSIFLLATVLAGCGVGLRRRITRG
jgi:hypothetical protein